MTFSLMVCRALLENCPEEEQSALLSLLPESELEKIQALSSAHLPEEHLLRADSLNWIHFSWFGPFLRTLPKQDLALILSALSKEQSTGLKDLLGFSETLPTATAFLKEFVRKLLLDQLNKEGELISPPYLPVTDFQPLSYLENKQLMRFLQYLGLYDLSFEMRHMIATAELKKILRVLHEEEAVFVREISHQRDPIVLKRLFLKNWDGKRLSLVSLLQGRGVHRLAVGLYGQESSLIWSLSHILDIGIAIQLRNLCKDPGEERVVHVINEQIQVVLRRFFK